MLQNLSEAEIAKIEKTGQQRQLPAGELLIQEGQQEHSFFLILSGTVEVRKALPQGRFKKLMALGSGDLVGEMGFLGAPSRSANVVVTEACSVLEFNHEKFEKFLDGNPAIALKIYRWIARELAKRLAASDEQLADAIVWGLGQALAATSKSADNAPEIPERQKLKFRGPPSHAAL